MSSLGEPLKRNVRFLFYEFEKASSTHCFSFNVPATFIVMAAFKGVFVYRDAEQLVVSERRNVFRVKRGGAKDQCCDRENGVESRHLV